MHNEQLPFHKTAARISVNDLRQYVEGWFLDCEIRQHSERTITKRKLLIDKFLWWLKHHEYAEVDTNTLRQFLAYVGNGHQQEGGRWGNPKEVQKNKPGTVASYHATLRTLFNWIVDEGGLEMTPMGRVSAPIDRPDQVQPFTPEQIDGLLCAAKKSHQRLRNETIVYFLLDTGVRVSELCQIKMRHLDIKMRSVIVEGKGGKQRIVYFGTWTTKALWRYLRDDQDIRDPESPLFLGEGSRSVAEGMTRNGILLLIRRLGAMAGIQQVRCSPHTFRHTFAISFLRNGGNQFSLMHLLGHTDLKQTSNYVQIAQADGARQHRMFSPVDRMRKLPM